MELLKIISLTVLLGAVLVAGAMFIQEKSSKGYTKERAKLGEGVARAIGVGVLVGTGVGILVNRENMHYFSALGMGLGILIGLLKGKFSGQR